MNNPNESRLLTFFTDKKKDPSYTLAQSIGLVLGPLLFALILLFVRPDDLAFKGVYVLAITAWIAIWWITEAIPIPATSLLPLVLLPLGHVMNSATVSAQYGNDIIYLFLGGFILAIAMERWDLHTRIALTIISSIGTSTGRILLGFMVATGGLSMFVSNTAAVMIMIPIGLAIIKEANALKTEADSDESIQKFERSLVLGIGYAGTIGGLGYAYWNAAFNHFKRAIRDKLWWRTELCEMDDCRYTNSHFTVIFSMAVLQIYRVPSRYEDIARRSKGHQRQIGRVR